MYKSGPPQCLYYNCIFANIWYLILLTQSIIIILRILMFYIQRVLADIWGRKDSVVGINKLFIAHSICTAALATVTNRAVFSTSTVCQDALFIKHKYAQDDCNWMNYFNQVSNVGKNTDIIATLSWVRLVHKCQIVKFWTKIESIRAFMRECAWRYAPARVGIHVQVGPTSILVL